MKAFSDSEDAVTNKKLERGTVAAVEVQLSIAVPGDNGFVYLMRRVTPAVIQVIDASGTIVRKLKVPPPLAYKQMTTLEIRYAKGRLGVLFVEQGETPNPMRIFRVVDADSGALIRDYQLPARAGSLACYSLDAITLLSSHDEKLAIKTVTLK